MTSWHEVRKVELSFGAKSSSWRSELHIVRSETEAFQLEAFFRRFETGDGVARWRTETGNWLRLTPKIPIVGDNAVSLQERLLPLLESVEARACDELFHIEIERRVPRPPVVMEVLHPTFDLSAIIRQCDPAKFEIRYSGEIEGSQETGWIFAPKPYPPGDPRNHALLITFADSLEDAAQVAAEEMEGIVRSSGVQFRTRWDG